MWASLLLFLFLFIQVYSAIVSICRRNRDFEKFFEDCAKFGINEYIRKRLVTEALRKIGLTELRSIMGFLLVGFHNNRTRPNEKELEAATTIEEYYKLKEPRNFEILFDPNVLKNDEVQFVIKTIEKRFPDVRPIFRIQLEECLHRLDVPTTLRKDDVDMMLKRFYKIYNRIQEEFHISEQKESICRHLKRVLHLYESSSDYFRAIVRTEGFVAKSNVALLETTTPLSSRADRLTEAINDFCRFDPVKDMIADDENPKKRHSHVMHDLFEAQQRIGLEELRNIIGFEKLGPRNNYTRPSEEEIKAASTIKQYYELKEPRPISEGTYIEYTINVLDKLYPNIRKNYRNKMEKIRQRPNAPVKINRDEIDVMLRVFNIISKRIHDEHEKNRERNWACYFVRYVYDINGIPSENLTSYSDHKLHLNTFFSEMF